MTRRKTPVKKAIAPVGNIEKMSLLARSSPKLALLALAATVCFPALNLTVEELKDAVDTSATTMCQLELLIDAWFKAFSTLAVAMFAFYTRGDKNE